jgi:hypothetical protein
MGCSDELLTATRYSIALEVASVLEVCLRFGRIVVSEIERPNLFVNLL